MSDEIKYNPGGISQDTVDELIYALREKHIVLRNAAVALRDAQKNYMAQRGNVHLGKLVAIRARELDIVLLQEDNGG